MQHMSASLTLNIFNDEHISRLTQVDHFYLTSRVVRYYLPKAVVEAGEDEDLMKGLATMVKMDQLFRCKLEVADGALYQARPKT
jgi:hypothetical protein